MAGYCLDGSKELLCDWTCSDINLYRKIYRIKLEKSGCKKITVFPTDSQLCVISNVVVFTDIELVENCETNGVEIQNGYFFLNQKPFLEFVLNGQESWLELQVSVLMFDIEPFSGIFSEMLDAVEQKCILEKKCIRYLNVNERLTQINQKNEDDIKELETKVAKILTEKEQLQHDKDAILKSTFWKMTKPLRKTADIIKKVGRKEKKMSFASLETITTFSGIISAAKGRYDIVLEDILKSYDSQDKKKILLFTHELALTGAPVAIIYFAEMLKMNDFLPVVISPVHGRLEEECEKYKIPVIVESDLYNSTCYLKYIHLFDAVIANTIASAPIINSLSETGIPVLWWIHEAEVSYKDINWSKFMPQQVLNNVSVYTVGDYAYKMLKKYRPLYSAKELLYFLPEVELESEKQDLLPIEAKGKKIFALIGLQEYRKGHDIFADAIRELSPEELEKAYFVFVGKKCHPIIYKKIEEILDYAPENTLWIEELNRTAIGQLYKQIDCLVCASRDDPMPIVATEALQHGKMLICSENTGTASIVERDNCGLVYRNNSSKELAEKIRYVLLNKESETEIESRYQIYKKYFSREIFEEKALAAIRDVLSLKWGKVPCFEYAPASFKDILNKLEAEKEQTSYAIFGTKNLLQYDNNQKQNILLISHELSLTGAPIVLHMLAKSLKNSGHNVVVISPFDGPLKEKILEDNIPVVVYPCLYSNIFIQQFAQNFQLIFANTVVAFRAIYQLRNSSIPIIWWIHDSEASYERGGFRNCMIDSLPEHVHVYCAGEYAKEKLLKYYPHYKEKADVLYYCSPDMAAKYTRESKYQLPFDKEERLLFAVIGQQDERKGHDILIEAIRHLNKKQREQAIFLFVGGHLDERIEREVNNLCNQYPKNVYYIEQIPHQKMFSLYEQCDCIICSSKDDPLPVFVTEAMMMSKIVICSENTGSAPILKKNNCGFVYENNDPLLLKKQIEYVMENYSKLDKMRLSARETYLNLFTEEIFEKKVNEIVKSHMLTNTLSVKYSGTVSVIVPTYNAGKQFEQFIQLIKLQKGIKHIELVVVDSGSSDGTVELCQKYEIVLKQIPNKEFTHSYARNLGAMQAKGDVLVFMTQDALPVGDYWLYNMIHPIINGEAAATSARELCPDESELFYKVASMTYTNFLKTVHESQLNQYYGTESIDELRRKASLTDIASAICAPIFRKYLYQYDYAEDLDMGIRLLKNGYKIKLLSDVRVLHGHSRSAGYYVRRGFVEYRALEKILPYFSIKRIASKEAAIKIISASEALDKTLNLMENVEINGYTAEAYIEEFLAFLRLNNTIGSIDKIETSFDDILFDKCIDICKRICIGEIENDLEIILSLENYIENELLSYLQENGLQMMNVDLADSIKDCVIKQFAVCTGNILSRAEYDHECIFEIQSLMVGV